MFNKLKQIKELRDQAKDIQNKLANETVSVSTEGGKINLIIDGNQQVMALDIDPEFLDPNQKERLEKALKEAYNDAIKKVQRLIAQKIQGGGLNLPDLGGL